MSYDLIGNGEQLLKHDGVYLSADMSTFNNTGTNMSNYKFIDYGPESANIYAVIGMPPLTYMIGSKDYLNPSPATWPFDSNASQPPNLSSKYGFVCITFDEYRQNSRTRADASWSYSYITDFVEHYPISMGWSLSWKTSSGTCYRLGGRACSMEFISGDSSKVKFNNNMWGISTPFIHCFYGTGPGYNLYDIWYNNNEIVYPISGTWNNTAVRNYTAVSNEGYYKTSSFLYRNKRLVSGELVKNSSKFLLDLSNNNLYYCDKENDNYRMLISAKVPKELPLYDIKNLFGIEEECNTQNAWGEKAYCWFLTKDLQVKYLNCPLEEAIAYKPSADTLINKDNVTVWDDIYLDNSSTPRYIVPGDSTVYTDSAMMTPSSFSGTGYYVLKCDISGITNRSSNTALGMLGGNMFNYDKYDEVLEAPVIPLSLTYFGTSSTDNNKFMGLGYTYVSSAPSGSASFDSRYKLFSNSFSSNLNKNNYITNNIPKSANRNVKAKWIFYAPVQYPSWGDFSIEPQIDYCLYDELISGYMPKGYVRFGRTGNKVMNNNNVYFKFDTLKWTGTTANPEVKYSNIEFFHTSSYYDALYG